MNNGYGGPAPRVEGSVLVELRKMNRVLEVDEDCACALVEPGVRFFDLYDALGPARSCGLGSRPGLGQRRRQRARQRRRLPPDRRRHAAAAGWRSCSRMASCCGPGWAGCRQPRLARLQAQPRPVARHALHAVELRDRDEDGRLADAVPGVLHAGLAAGLDEDDLAALVETLRPLMIEGRSRIRRSNTIASASVLVREQWYEGEEPIPDDVSTRSPRAEVGRWVMRFALYGDEPVVAHQLPQGEGGLRADPRRRGLVLEACAGRLAGARESARARPGRRPQPGPQPDDPLVRRRAGRPHRLLARRR